MLAISIDGRLALPAGGKTHLGGKGDQQALEEALTWSDCTLMGARTLQAHQSTCLIKTTKFIKQRRSENRSDQPISIIVSKHNPYDDNWPFFTQEIERWLLTKSENSLEKPMLKGYNNSLFLKATWSETLDQLKNFGLQRIVLLGGAELTESLLIEDQIDELYLTITPKVVGGTHTWIPAKDDLLPLTLMNSDSWHLKSTKRLDNHELLMRYFRNRR